LANAICVHLLGAPRVGALEHAGEVCVNLADDGRRDGFAAGGAARLGVVCGRAARGRHTLHFVAHGAATEGVGELGLEVGNLLAGALVVPFLGRGCGVEQCGVLVVDHLQASGLFGDFDVDLGDLVGVPAQAVPADDVFSQRGARRSPTFFSLACCAPGTVCLAAPFSGAPQKASSTREN